MYRLKAAILTLHSRVEPARLKAPYIVASVSLSIGILPGHPGFNVYLSLVGKAHVAGADRHHLIRQLKLLHKILLYSNDEILLCYAVFGLRKAFYLQLIELVQTQNAARIF